MYHIRLVVCSIWLLSSDKVVDIAVSGSDKDKSGVFISALYVAVVKKLDNSDILLSSLI